MITYDLSVLKLRNVVIFDGDEKLYSQRMIRKFENITKIEDIASKLILEYS
jgi:hypothetical protein